MLNYCLEDTIIGLSIYGLWTADKNVENLYKIIKGGDGNNLKYK